MDNLPEDTLYEIAEFLEVHDIVNLRSVNRHLYSVFTSNRLWKAFSQKRWFSIDDQPSMMLNDVQDCCAYYRNRSRTDLEIHKLINKIAKSDEAKEIFEIGWSIIRMNYRAVPILNQLRKDHSDLSKRFYSFVLLMSIRHSEAYRACKALKDEELESNSTAEEFFFQMSYIDPAFDDLLPLRNKVIEAVIEGVQNHPSYKETSPASYVILLIRSVFLHVVRKSPLIKGMSSLEDNFILRIYAGEANGQSLVFRSIIQKIASYFGINSKLSQSFMIIEDKTFNSGYSYAILDANRAKVFSHAHIARSLRASVENLEEYMAPITGKVLIDAFLQPFKYPLHNSFNSADYKNIYPYSKVGVTTESIALFDAYVRAASPELFPSLAGISPGTEVYQKVSGDNLVDQLTKTMPFDLIHLQSLPYFQNQKKFERIKKDIFEEYYKFEIFFLVSETDNELTADLQKPIFNIGDVVHHQRSGKLSIILGYKRTETTVFYNGFTDFGDSRVYEGDTLQKVERVTKNMYDFLTREAWIGLFFTHFDKNSNRFIPTSHLSKLYPVIC